jgi:type II secretory pathway pseudopilin PulG
MKHGHNARGITLVEVIITVAIITLLLSQAMPSFGNAGRAARERSLVQKLVQDFAWSRAAAGTADAATLGISNGAPTVVLTLNADCSWTTTINGIVDTTHSLTTAQLAATTPNMACAPTGLSLPAAFTFTPQGFVDTTGNITYTGASGQAFPLTILFSGSIIRNSPVSGTQS